LNGPQGSSWPGAAGPVGLLKDSWRQQIQTGPHTITAADSLPDDLREALDHIHRDHGAH
jgi:hypothetical protein